MAATAAGKRSIDLVREFNDVVFNGRDYDRLDEFQAADYVQHGPMADQDVRGRDELLETMQLFHGAFSDLEATEELAFSDETGEYVCTVYTYRGTHDGDFLGIPPTDETGEVTGVVINRFEDGTPVEGWVVVDLLDLLQDVGAVPGLDELAA